MFVPTKGFRCRADSLVVLMTIALLGTLGILGSAAPARAIEPYGGIQLGAYVWPAFSNRNQVEADTLPGISVSLLGGIEMRMNELWPTAPTTFGERFGTRIELEVNERISAIHGVNDSAGQRTADGQTLYATSALVNVWPSWQWSPRWRTYLGAGVGVSWIRALGSDASVFSVQTGAGVVVDFPLGSWTLGLDIGWRSLWSSSVELTAGRTDFDSHGGVIGLQFRK